MWDSFELLLVPIMLWCARAAAAAASDCVAHAGLRGLSNALVSPALSAFSADIASDSETRSQMLTLPRMAGDAAFLVSPLGLGLVAEAYGCSTALLGCAGAMALSTAFFALRCTGGYSAAAPKGR